MCVMCEGKRVCVCVNHLQANSSVITIPPCVCVCMCVHIYMCVCVCVCQYHVLYMLIERNVTALLCKKAAQYSHPRKWH